MGGGEGPRPSPSSASLTDFGLSSNRHKDQAPAAAAAGVTYGFPQPARRPPAARRRRTQTLAARVHRRSAAEVFNEILCMGFTLPRTFFLLQR